MLQKKVRGETLADPTLRDEEVLDERGLRMPPHLLDEISEPFGNSIHQTRSG